MFGIMVSLWWMFSSIACLIEVEPMIHLGGPVGFMFWNQYMSSGTHAFIACGGVIFHAWAARQHVDHIRKLDTADEFPHWS